MYYSCIAAAMIVIWRTGLDSSVFMPCINTRSYILNSRHKTAELSALIYRFIPYTIPSISRGLKKTEATWHWGMQQCLNMPWLCCTACPIPSPHLNPHYRATSNIIDLGVGAPDYKGQLLRFIYYLLRLQPWHWFLIPFDDTVEYQMLVKSSC